MSAMPNCATPNWAIAGVVTTFNNAQTLSRCLASLKAICSEIVVLDSGSTDRTREIAESFGARFYVQAFAGYSAQKTAAIALATADWIVLLDSDEALDDVAQKAICAALPALTALTLTPETSAISGFRLKRRELIFWRYQHAFSKHNRFLRVFDRRKARMSGHTVHESVLVTGKVGDLAGCIMHEGDRSIEQKLTKLNQYSSLAALAKRPPPGFASAFRLTLYPVWYFFRAYLLRRQFLNGWAGYINSVELAHYAFLKYAKMLEQAKKTQEKKTQAKILATEKEGST